MSHRTSRLPFQLLRAVREIADGVRLLWGPPARIALCESMPRGDYARLAEWLGWLERSTRALVIYLALRLIPTLRRREPACRKPRPRIPELWLCSPSYPAGWRAPFSIPMPALNPDARDHAAARDEYPTPVLRLNRPCPPGARSTRPLAVRFEAVCRVLADPRIRARAHAARLLKLAAANRVSNAPDDILARIVKPLLPASRRNPPHHALIAARAGEPVFARLIDVVFDLFERGVLSRRSLEPG